MAANWFDAGGEAYARFRPEYPASLAAALAAASPARGTAVDVGCGTGQLTALLADEFAEAVGVDPSASQLASATAHPRARYVEAPAEALPLPDASADLVTAAQAAHWFDLPAFFAEARRIARPGAPIALVSYGAPALEPDLDERFQRFYAAEIGPFWPPERRLVDEGYRSIDLPFPERAFEAEPIERRMPLAGLLGYLSTWSATRAAREAGREDLLAGYAADLEAAWGDPARERVVRWPVVVRLGIR